MACECVKVSLCERGSEKDGEVDHVREWKEKGYEAARVRVWCVKCREVDRMHGWREKGRDMFGGNKWFARGHEVAREHVLSEEMPQCDSGPSEGHGTTRVRARCVKDRGMSHV